MRPVIEWVKQNWKWFVLLGVFVAGVLAAKPWA